MLKIISIVLTIICSYCIYKLYMNLYNLLKENKDLENQIIDLLQEIDYLKFEKDKECLNEKDN